MEKKKKKKKNRIFVFFEIENLIKQGKDDWKHKEKAKLKSKVNTKEMREGEIWDCMLIVQLVHHEGCMHKWVCVIIEK